MSEVKTALQIFRILLEDGQLDRDTNDELFIEYLNPEVQETLNNFEEEFFCSIIRVNNTIYLIPSSSNSFLGFRSKDFREWIGSNARLSDVYLSYYISMYILYLFYGGKNKNPKQREFLRIDSLIDELDRRFELVLKSDSGNMEMLEEQYSINFIKIAENWDSKKGYEENKRTTKYGTAMRICRLLEQEKLIKIIDDEKEIRTTKKLDDLMIYYYLNDSRIQEINDIFEGVKRTDASNKQSQDN